MLPFLDAAPTPAGDWRHIVRFGRNVASYKFALGRALLNLWLEQRGEHLIASHHPLRETLISQLGLDRATRHQTLARRHTAATAMIPSWTPSVT